MDNLLPILGAFQFCFHFPTILNYMKITVKLSPAWEISICVDFNFQNVH